ncbi:MAG: 3'-5' exonuclease [Patescibacteria group bacterium]
MSNIAFTDFEMSGLDSLRHEIVEFGVVVADADTLEIIGEMDKKVRMERPESADPESLVFLGYRDELWKDAISIREALEEYSALARGALFAAWNTPYDWTFLVEAYRQNGIKNPLDYHSLDVASVAYEKLRLEPDFSIKLTAICKRLAIEKEPMPHRAINGARTAYEVYKKLRAL